jgi:Domain of unknown function (DUF1990)
MVDPDTPVKKEARFCVCVKEVLPWLMMPLQIAYVTSTVKGPTKGSFSFGSGTLQGHLLVLAAFSFFYILLSEME